MFRTKWWTELPSAISQSNAEKRHMITEKSNSPKYRTTGIYGEAISSCLPLLFRGTKKIAMTSTNQHRRNESSDAFPARNWEMFKVDPFPCTYLLLSAAAVAKHLQYDHSRLQIFGYLVITWCTMDPNTTNSIPHVRKSHANLPKRETKWEKLLRCPVKVVLKRSRSRSTFHFSKSSRPFIQY